MYEITMNWNILVDIDSLTKPQASNSNDGFVYIQANSLYKKTNIVNYKSNVFVFDRQVEKEGYVYKYFTRYSFLPEYEDFVYVYKDNIYQRKYIIRDNRHSCDTSTCDIFNNIDVTPTNSFYLCIDIFDDRKEYSFCLEEEKCQITNQFNIRYIFKCTPTFGFKDEIKTEDIEYKDYIDMKKIINDNSIENKIKQKDKIHNSTLSYALDMMSYPNYFNRWKEIQINILPIEFLMLFPKTISSICVEYLTSTFYFPCQCKFLSYWHKIGDQFMCFSAGNK